ncbi:MAG: sulfatase-like hydrolase/transferase [Verrucomicrobiales bacterium]|nr:sulfatase-like hydrolase/transferase [Verrucomicrobiales bacterium]
MFRIVLSLAASFTVLTAEAKPPNILFLLADDMRPDCIAALGNDRIRTPNLDRLVAEGMTFSRATCSYPICVVSRSEMITGRHGWENGVTGFRGAKFAPEQTFWAEALHKGGYETWHVGKWHVSGRPSTRGYSDIAGLFSGGGGKYWKEGQVDWKGFPITGYRGWIFQSDDGKEKYPELGVGVTPDISEKFIDAAVSLVARKPDKPWFCHVNFTAPHDPLFIPPGMEGKYKNEDMQLPEDYLPVHPFDHGNFDGRDEALLAWPRTEIAVKDLLRVYYSVIEDMDAQIGRLLETLEATGQMENTIIIFTSDHGMGCGSHGLRGKQSMYEHTINVPFVVTGPDIEPGSDTRAQIYLRDLYPTTCELAGIPIPASVTATSFAPVLRGEAKSHHDTIYGYFTNTQRMIRTDDGWKFIYYPQIDHQQLFDLNSDPFELSNLADSVNPEHQKQLDHLEKRLDDWRTQTGDPLLARP